MPLVSLCSISCFFPSKSEHTSYKLVIEMIQYTSCFSKINCSIVQYMYNHWLIYGQSLPSPASPRQIPSRAQRRAVLQSHDAAAAITRRGGCNHELFPAGLKNVEIPTFHIFTLWKYGSCRTFSPIILWFLPVFICFHGNFHKLFFPIFWNPWYIRAGNVVWNLFPFFRDYCPVNSVLIMSWPCPNHILALLQLPTL